MRSGTNSQPGVIAWAGGLPDCWAGGIDALQGGATARAAMPRRRSEKSAAHGPCRTVRAAR
jgi:hypothetical protein